MFARRVPPGEACIGHRPLYIPCNVFNSPFQRAAVHSALVWRVGRVVRASLLWLEGQRLTCPVRRFNATPENVWGCLHGFTGLGFAIWWQATVQIAAAMRAQMLKTQ